MNLFKNIYFAFENCGCLLFVQIGLFLTYPTAFSDGMKGRRLWNKKQLEIDIKTAEEESAIQAVQAWIKAAKHEGKE